ncbi:hypothetical protein SARC_11653, partial [Sphaeroforma arctica JP610]
MPLAVSNHWYSDELQLHLLKDGSVVRLFSAAQDFGEQFVERQMTDLFVVDLETRDVSRVNIKENDPDTPVAMATPVWAPNSDTLAMFDASAKISVAVRTASFHKVSTQNDFGDEQLAIDLMCDKAIFDALRDCGACAT